MSQCLRTTLNPPKTLLRNPTKSSPVSSPLIHLPKSKKHSRISMSQQNQQELSLDSLINSTRKEESLVPSRLFVLFLNKTVPALKSKVRGKVRVYMMPGYLVLVNDRQSAFDKILASIPSKDILNETSLWWFDRTRHIAQNAIVSAPDKNVTIAKKCSVFPVEFVVRGYVTGSTDTSLWTVYKNGVRNYCGNALPDGLVKSQKLPSNILTTAIYVPITLRVKSGLMTEADYCEVSSKALSCLNMDSVCIRAWLDFSNTNMIWKGSDGSVLLIDEVHTPDSSRYWIAHSYEERFKKGLEPENVDKVLPDAPADLVCELAWRYIFLYETITKSKFELPLTEEPIHDRISRNVELALSSLR
uniref:phosphoribosylaminoimidazolesuccinocarboxamide synthase n=1 Tax=Salix viminalis TaxID=40686 RepID=A0A6N2LI74_SALVM